MNDDTTTTTAEDGTTATKAPARKRKTNRGGQGRGSVFQRKTDGRWVAQITTRDENGKRRQRQFVARTEKGAGERLDEYLALTKVGRPLPDLRESVGHWLTYWNTHVRPGTVRDTTVDADRGVIESYIAPTDDPNRPRVRLRRADGLYDKRIGTLSAQDVQTWLRALEATGLAPATRRKAYNVLSKSMAAAVKFGKCAHNPVRDVDPPRATHHKTDDALDLDEARRLLAAAEGHPLEALFTLAVSCGLRVGEATALTWSNVDLDACLARVTGTMRRRTGHGLIVNPTKTAAGMRVVPLPAPVVESLRRHKRRQEEGQTVVSLHGERYVFAMADGRPLDQRFVLGQFHKITEDVFGRRIRFHALRHSCASILLAQGVPLIEVSQILGHAGTQVTSAFYAHLSTDVLRRGADVMGAALFTGTTDR